MIKDSKESGAQGKVKKTMRFALCSLRISKSITKSNKSKLTTRKLKIITVNNQ